MTTSLILKLIWPAARNRQLNTSETRHTQLKKLHRTRQIIKIMARMTRLAILAVALLFGALAQTTVAVTTHVVGDSTGWVVPPNDNNLFYAVWAAKQTFYIGDILRT